MAKGKAPESEAFKATAKAFDTLSEQDQQFFRNKLFLKLCYGLTPNRCKGFKKKRLDFITELNNAKAEAKQLEAFSNLSVEAMEKARQLKKKLGSKPFYPETKISLT